jgi:hypothetical protein
MTHTRSALFTLFAVAFAFLGGCAPQLETQRSFQDDVNFLSRNVYTIVLTDLHGQAQIAVVPQFQGTVMTSTAEGAHGQSYGYFDHDLIKSRAFNPHFNLYGGEDRLSVGPSGGQYSVNFPAGADFTPENLQVPAPLDREAFDVVERAADHLTLQKKFSVTNYSNKTFQLRLTRTIRVLTREDSWRQLGATGSEDLNIVAFESKNQIVNASHIPWRKEEGLLNLSVTGMFARTSDVALVLPTRTPAQSAEPGVVALPAALVTSAANPAKTTLSPKNTKGLVGSFDPATSTLTIVQFMPIQPNGLYMAGDWKIQPHPYAGDAATVSGGPANAFFMLSTSSPAFELDAWQAAGQPFTVRTFHIRGRAALLDPVAHAVLGVSLEDISAAIPAITPK